MSAKGGVCRGAWRGAIVVLVVLAPGLYAKKFYNDDPLRKEPTPVNAENINARKLSDYYDFLTNTFGRPGERQRKGKLIRARAVNTLGEVMDSAWYTNRHYMTPMSIEELERGPGTARAPYTSGPLTVVSAKTAGVMPGFRMRDAKGRLYFVKFDPKTNPEMATAADVIVSKFFYALGYNVPENYLLMFNRQQLRVAPDATLTDVRGKRRPMTDRDVTDILLTVPQGPDGRYRAVASLAIAGKSVGEFRYHGMRQDDPNDIVPHEDRRDLRGLRLFCAWQGHDDTRDVNTFDALVEQDGRKFIKHYLIDFGAALGSDSNWPNSPRSGNVYWFDWTTSAEQLFSLGLIVPRWARAKYPKIPAAGRFEADIFDPGKWVPFYPNAAFANCLPDDAFWAVKQIMAFTDEQIRAIVKTGQYSDPEAENWIVRCLIKRRDKIGKTYFAKVLPLDRFEVRGGKLAFDDLAVKHGFISSPDYTVQWSRFNNDTERKAGLSGHTGFALPPEVEEAAAGEYFAADIKGADNHKTITVYIQKCAGGARVVGIDRTW